MSFTDNSRIAAKNTPNTLENIITSARAQRPTLPVRYDTLLQVQLELRKKRMSTIGSGIAFSSFLYPTEHTMHTGVVDLIEFLSLRTVALWGKPKGDYLRFCRQFYELSLSCPEWVTLDDVILFATTLVHSEKSIYTYVMKELLPEAYHEMIQSFAQDFPDEFYSASFEDVVLGAVCILLGVLKDNVEEEETTSV